MANTSGRVIGVTHGFIPCRTKNEKERKEFSASDIVPTPPPTPIAVVKMDPGDDVNNPPQPNGAQSKSEENKEEPPDDIGSTSYPSHIWRKFHWQPSLYLENSGSVARDHLASERTFLAYVRTSLMLATSGVAFVQLFAISSANDASANVISKLRKFSRPLGAAMILFGFAVLLLGLCRFFVIQRALTKGFFPVTRFAVISMAIILSTLVLTTFGILVSPKLRVST